MSPSLAERVESAAADERVPVIVTLRRQVDAERYEDRPGALLVALHRASARSQHALEDLVDRPTRRFWLVNAHAVSATPAEITEIAADPNIERVDLDPPVRAHDAVQSAIPNPTPGDGNWGLDAAGILSARAVSGTSGRGVVVGSIDTGVDASHPQLGGRVVAFRDFVNGQGTPYDDNGHGTHTLGTMIGAEAAGTAIGVAPEATAVVAKAMNAGGSGSGSNLLAAAQWMTDPDGDPSTHDQPDVINNSWAASGANDPWFHQMIRRWTQLGIVPIFAVGNTGPGPSSIGSPASYPEAIAVGAHTKSGDVPAFSARGPVVWQNVDQLGPASGTSLTKPDLVAPGVGITSTGPGGFLNYSGTSMASPHVAGVVALMREQAPELTPDAIGSILRATARDIGQPGHDADAGAGRLDAVAALGAVSGPVPDTSLVHTPPATTRAQAATYGVALSAAAMARYRVDGGPWSAPTPGSTLRVPIDREGDHEVEVQAVGASGAVDPSPAKHVLTVDRTPPRVKIGWRRTGDRTTFVGVVDDALSDVRTDRARWSLGKGVRGVGRRVRVRFVEAGRRRVQLVVSDAAGNHARTTRLITPRVSTPVRRLRVNTRGRSAGSGWLRVSGRLTRPAGLRSVLRPVTGVAPLATSSIDAAISVGKPALRARERRRRGGFVLRLPTRRLAPGLYRLELTATERSRRSGGPIVRTVRVRR